jgi:hypothetical protein
MFPPPFARRSTIHPMRSSRSRFRIVVWMLEANAVAASALPLKEPTRT